MLGPEPAWRLVGECALITFSGSLIHYNCEGRPYSSSSLIWASTLAYIWVSHLARRQGLSPQLGVDGL